MQVTVTGRYCGHKVDEFKDDAGKVIAYGQVVVFDEEGVEVIAAKPSEQFGKAAIDAAFAGMKFGDTVTVRVDIRAAGKKQMDYRLLSVVGSKANAA